MALLMDQSQESGELLRDKMHACVPWNFQELARTDKLKIALRQIYTRQIILQKRIIQIITKSQYDAHAPPIFYKLKLLALKGYAHGAGVQSNMTLSHDFICLYHHSYLR